MLIVPSSSWGLLTAPPCLAQETENKEGWRKERTMPRNAKNSCGVIPWERRGRDKYRSWGGKPWRRVPWGTVLPSTWPGGHLALLIVVLFLCGVKHRLLSTAAVLFWEKEGRYVEFNASLSCFKQQQRKPSTLISPSPIRLVGCVFSYE